MPLPRPFADAASSSSSAMRSNPPPLTSSSNEPTSAVPVGSISNSTARTRSTIASCLYASLNISPVSSSSLIRSNPALSKSISIGSGSASRTGSAGPSSSLPLRPRPRPRFGLSSGVGGGRISSMASSDIGSEAGVSVLSASGSATSWADSICFSRSTRWRSTWSRASRLTSSVAPFLPFSMTMRSISSSSSKKSDTYRNASRSRPISTNADCIPGSTRITRPL